MMLVMQSSLSAQQLVDLRIAGLPGTARGIRKQAEREGWAAVDRPGRGGGRAYLVEDLPDAAQADLAARRAAIPMPPRPVGRPKGATWWAKHPDVATAVEAYVSSQVLAAPRVHELLATQFDDLPSVRTLKRYMTELERTRPAVLASLRDPDAYKSKYRISLGRADAALTHAHQLWEIDTTQADVICKEGRRSILGIIDVWSRRAFYLVVPSESAQSVRRTLVAAIVKWGVIPERLKTDQGSGYINATIVSALPFLDIEHEPCPPGSPERKPHVERLFGTFQRERTELLAGYVGHNVAEATRLRAAARKKTGRAVIVPEMSEGELQAVIDNWLDGVYHQRVHSTTKATPLSRWTNSPVPARKAPDAGTLKLALSAAVGTSVVGKQGVRWKHGRYWSASLVPYVGRSVHVRRDEDDLGALFIFDEDQRYIDTALNAERAGMSDQDFARAARRQQQEHDAAARAELRAKQRRFRIEDARDALLRHDAEQAGKLVSLPVASVKHETPTIASITARPEPALPTPAAMAAAARMVRAPATLSIEERIADTDRILADHAAGRSVATDALQAARIFAGSSDYRAAKIVAANFAPRTPHTPQMKEARS